MALSFWLGWTSTPWKLAQSIARALQRYFPRRACLFHLFQRRSLGICHFHAMNPFGFHGYKSRRDVERAVQALTAE
jgi:hypothetical protein